MSNRETRPKPVPPNAPMPHTVERSLTGAVIQTLNDVKQGAGWTTGALLVGGAVKKGAGIVKGDRKD